MKTMRKLAQKVADAIGEDSPPPQRKATFNGLRVAPAPRELRWVDSTMPSDSGRPFEPWQDYIYDDHKDWFAIGVHGRPCIKQWDQCEGKVAYFTKRLQFLQERERLPDIQGNIASALRKHDYESYNIEVKARVHQYFMARIFAQIADEYKFRAIPHAITDEELKAEFSRVARQSLEGCAQAWLAHAKPFLQWVDLPPPIPADAVVQTLPRPKPARPPLPPSFIPVVPLGIERVVPSAPPLHEEFTTWGAGNYGKQ